MEKSKLVYILNRDAAANLTISSPLEAHKNHATIHHVVGVDDPSGEAFNNAEKMLTFYELDLGLNHVVRKWSESTDTRANYSFKFLEHVLGRQMTLMVLLGS
ncbi:pre-mRNA-splicing factor rse1 [Tulasnella sp. 419]|nr:pre-mRNA-splicing factor rse1 [Tulasnella sp. 419]